MQHSVLAIDGGQSGIRARLAHADGTGGVRPAGQVFECDGLLTHEPLAPQVAAVVRRVSETTGASMTRPAITHVAAGLSGLVDAHATATELLALTASDGVERTLITHDSVTSYLGALGHTPGIVTAAGTGVVTLAVGPEHHARVDGWGFSMGDAGSGFWIGRAVLDAVMRAHDGRGTPTSLTDVVADDLGDLPTAYIRLQADPRWVSRTARFAAAAAEHAGHDAVAHQICQAAGAELAHAIRTAARVAGLDQRADAAHGDPANMPVPVCLLGGVLRQETGRPNPVREATVAALAGPALNGANSEAPLPEFQVRDAATDALTGAGLLPSLNADSPLRDLVSAAG